jgi:hypothetical protein
LDFFNPLRAQILKPGKPDQAARETDEAKEQRRNTCDQKPDWT